MGRNKDARTFAIGQDALRTLIKAGETGATGIELFGTSYRGKWGWVLMRRLSDMGLVLRSEPSSGTTGRNPVVFKAMPALLAEVEDDTRMASLLWPKRADPAPWGDAGEATPADVAEPVVRDVATSGYEAAAEVGGVYGTDRELLETLLKLCAATLENVAHMRVRVDELAKEVAGINEAWK